MGLFEMILAYFTIGIIAGMSIESLMDETGLNETTSNFERFLWVAIWPLFVLLFIFGMKK